MRTPAAGRDGFALVAVLWVLVVAGALAAEVHAGVRADQRVAANARAEARARWAARGAVAEAVEALRARLAEDAAGGTGLVSTDTLLVPPVGLELDGVVATAVATDARARLDLNRATPGELAALWRALGWDARRADALAEAVARWRAERLPPFLAAPVDTLRPPIRPAAGPFAAVEALRGVPGVAEDEYGAAEPYLTVASDGRINLNTAALPVLATLPGVDPRAAEAIAGLRERAPLSTIYDLADALPAGSREALQDRLAELIPRAAFVPREVEIRAVGRAPGSPVEVRIRAVAVMAGGTRLPVVRVAER